MRKFATSFLYKGFSACGIGPVILAVLYLILHRTAAVDMLTVNQVCIGIFSITALAFIAGGMNAIYQIERLPLMLAIFIHGSVLYICYLVTYLLNDWLAFGVMPIVVFSVIFVMGFVVIWAIIYSIIKRRTDKLNEMLKTQQQFKSR